MQIEASFVTSAAGPGDFPTDRLAEVVLVGRSNVGKSSLINALVRQPLARTSAAPGKTRLANFYRVRRGSTPPFYLVDLPGYGYARGGDASSRAFDALTTAYFDLRLGPSTGLRAGPSGTTPPEAGPGGRVAMGVLLLVDARHPGLESDLEAWAWVQSLPCPGGIVGTKVDKLSRAERVRHARLFESSFDLPVPLVSAHTGEGLDTLWTLIARLPKPTAA